jgi:hypothetical protein
MEDTIKWMGSIDAKKTQKLIDSGEVKYIDKKDKEGQIAYLKIKLEENLEDQEFCIFVL